MEEDWEIRIVLPNCLQQGADEKSQLESEFRGEDWKSGAQLLYISLAKLSDISRK